MTARDEILERVRGATADVVTAPGALRAGVVPQAPQALPDETVGLFAERVADYRAEVVRVAPAQAGLAITDALRRHRCGDVVLAPGLPEEWVAASTAAARVHVDDGRLTATDLDRMDAVVTGAALAIATTGTLVLDHRADQGRRAITLVPDVHVCVVRAGQVVQDVPEAVAVLRPQVGRARPLTWVSGPSATSDIELERVEGVHGPRTLVVVLVEDSDGR